MHCIHIDICMHIVHCLKRTQNDFSSSLAIEFRITRLANCMQNYNYTFWYANFNETDRHAIDRPIAAETGRNKRCTPLSPPLDVVARIRSRKMNRMYRSGRKHCINYQMNSGSGCYILHSYQSILVSRTAACVHCKLCVITHLRLMKI